ncbi:MAG: STAS domain-containing protein [Ruminococcus sp.]|nr:STAS domain-containing protein [Ruminococcus sp.]
MLTVNKNQQDTNLTLEIIGRVDTTTAPQLENVMEQSLDGITELTMDLAGLEYMSSAGLRVLLMVQKKMNVQGNMKLINVNDDIMEIFEITGFADILTIE